MPFKLLKGACVSDAQKTAFAFSGSLDATFDKVWQLFARGVADRHASERHPTLATVGVDGTAQMRTVVLRAVDREASMLEFHTDLKSMKVSEIEAEPSCSMHVWNPKSKLQMRLRATAEILKGEAVDHIWARVPEGSRRAYGGSPLPGTPLKQPEEFESGFERERFAVVRLSLQSNETLCLAPEQHYRAVFKREDNWSGQWLAP